ncbi:MAG: hypothetical protein IT449_03490 [Phycisphaerales bacterium]|nr:hypothetical protein [Phycisphaerales bacterium]
MMKRILASCGFLLPLGLLGGCGNVLPPAPAHLFYLPLEIEGRPTDPAFIDTGGEFEVLLKDAHGLAIRDEIDILAFTGTERVPLTEPFSYRVGDIELQTQGAIVGLSACVCNGVGLAFLKKSNRVLHFDFPAKTASLVDSVPVEAAVVPLSRPTGRLATFQGIFAEVEVTGPDGVSVLHGLLDSGATRTVLRSGLVGAGDAVNADQMEITIGSDYLGTARLTAALFDTEGLPDLIIGTDLMGAWADHWYMNFDDASGVMWVSWSGADSSGGGSVANGVRTSD